MAGYEGSGGVGPRQEILWQGRTHAGSGYSAQGAPADAWTKTSYPGTGYSSGYGGATEKWTKPSGTEELGSRPNHFGSASSSYWSPTPNSTTGGYGTHGGATTGGYGYGNPTTGGYGYGRATTGGYGYGNGDGRATTGGYGYGYGYGKGSGNGSDGGGSYGNSSDYSSKERYKYKQNDTYDDYYSGGRAKPGRTTWGQSAPATCYHDQGQISTPTNEIGAAMEHLLEVSKSSAAQPNSPYAASTANYDSRPVSGNRYGNFKLSSRGPY